MEAPKSEAPKLPDMVMCGDHPSFTKTELNVKTDPKVDEKDKDKVKEKVLSYAKITPSDVRTERPERTERCGERATSEHALRLSEARRRVRSLEVVQRPDVDVQATGNRALMHAALGSFRWPPYLLCVWVLVLVLTHGLHCLVSLLERALPALRKCTVSFRAWTAASWRARVGAGARTRPGALALGACGPGALALATCALHALYYALCGAHAVLLWAIQPLCSDAGGSQHEVLDALGALDALDAEREVTDYEDDLADACHKP